MKSRFSNLVVSGCSFTTNEHVPDGSNWNWANILAKDTGMDIHNLATAGAGNTHIANSIILYLAQHPELTPENTLVMAMWSGAGRIDLLTSTEFKPLNKVAAACVYNSKVACLPGGNWWNVRIPSLEANTVKNLARMSSSYSFALASWLEIQKLENFLKCKEFTYRFTSFLNYDINLIKGDALAVPFEKCLQTLGLSLDKTHWLPLEDRKSVV